MAARLVRIKAQMLLPRREGDEQWEDPRAELVRRLLEYQQVREVVDILEARGNDRRNRFARAYLPQNLMAPAPVGALSVSVSELLRDKVSEQQSPGLLRHMLVDKCQAECLAVPDPFDDRGGPRRWSGMGLDELHRGHPADARWRDPGDRARPTQGKRHRPGDEPAAERGLHAISR